MDGNALNSVCPKDLLYLRQGSSQCHKDLHTAGYPDFRKSTPQYQQHKKMPLVRAVPHANFRWVNKKFPPRKKEIPTSTVKENDREKLS
jgi:hypothetical protein